MFSRSARNLLRAFGRTMAVTSAIFCMLFLSTPIQAEKRITVAMPAFDMGLQRSFEGLAQLIYEKSSGELSLDLIYDHGMQGLEAIEAVKDGSFYLAPVLSGVLDRPDLVPGLNETFLLTGPYQIQLALERKSDFLRQALGVQYLSTAYLGTYAMVGAGPFDNPERIKGKRIASVSDFTPFGAIDTKTPWADVIQVFERGYLDGFETYIFDPKLEKLTGNSLTLTNHRFAAASTFVNKEFFEFLNESERTLLHSQMNEWATAFGLGVVEQENRQLELLQEHGISISPADLSSFRLRVPVDDKVLSFFHQVSGSPGCVSPDQCKCKTGVYGTKCSCDRACKTNSDCKP